MDKENIEENQSDEAYYKEPHYNIKDENKDFEKEHDTDILLFVSSLFKKAQLFCLVVKTASSM